jgi:dolichol-phosphate mannosyltransferase
VGRGEGLVVVLPTFNEAAQLPPLLRSLRLCLPEARLVVVDDRSPDGTGRIAEALAAEDPLMHIIHRDGPRGLRAAVVAGLRWGADQANTRRLVQMDADGSHPVLALPALLEATEGPLGADLALGCRYMPGGGVEGWAAHRRALSWAGNRYARAWLGSSLRDLTGGLKCWRVEALAAVGLDRLAAQGYAFQIEASHRAERAGLRVAEVPFVFVERRGGRSKMSARIAAEAAWRVPALRWSARRGG